MEMGCKVPAPVFWSQMTVYLLLVLLSLLKNICGQVRQLQLGFDAESPRSDFTHERSSQGIDRVEFWGQNDSARHPSKLAGTSLELARSLPAKLEGGKRVASSDLRVHVPRMGTSSQSSLYIQYMYKMYMLMKKVTVTRALKIIHPILIRLLVF